MALRIETFDNARGGNTLYKALSHPHAARAGGALIAELARGQPLAIVDPQGAAAGFAEWSAGPQPRRASHSRRAPHQSARLSRPDEFRDQFRAVSRLRRPTHTRGDGELLGRLWLDRRHLVVDPVRWGWRDRRRVERNL